MKPGQASSVQQVQPLLDQSSRTSNPGSGDLEKQNIATPQHLSCAYVSALTLLKDAVSTSETPNFFPAMPNEENGCAESRRAPCVVGHGRGHSLEVDLALLSLARHLGLLSERMGFE